MIPEELIPCKQESNTLRLLNTDYGFDHKIIYELDPYVVTKIKYISSRKSYQLYTPHFGWKDRSQSDCNKISRVLTETAFDNPGRELLVGGVGGYRKDTLQHETSSNDQLIPTKFQQSTYVTSNNCVWLAAALVVNSVDHEFADIMIESFQACPDLYEWLKIYNKKGNKNNLVEKLKNIQPIAYEVRKIKGVSSLYMTNHILNIQKSGLLVCMLENSIGESSHCVGINLNKQTIYDCMEKRVHELTIPNLSICCGDKDFQKFGTVAELHLQPRKKRKFA